MNPCKEIDVMKHGYTKGNKSAHGSKKGGDADSGKMGSNSGATGGLKSAPANGGNGTMSKPSTRNPYPNGMA